MEYPKQLNFLNNRKKPLKISTEDCFNKTVVISGATSGVGLEAVKQYGKHHANIIIVVRNKEKAEQVINLYPEFNISYIIADFSDFDSVKNAAAELKKQTNTIDILINSVGIHQTKKQFSKHNIELVFTVNHLSVLLFTYLLLDLVNNSKQGRIIQVNSQGHRFGKVRLHDYNFKKVPYVGLRAYGQSKTAQLLTMKKFEELLQETNTTINCMHPGGVKTNIGMNNGLLYRLWAKVFINRFLKDPIISGQSLYYIGTAPELSNTTGKFFNLTEIEEPADHATDINSVEPVWELSKKLIGIK